MNSKKILIAVAFLLTATSASWAQGGRFYYGGSFGPGSGGPAAYGNFGDYYAPEDGAYSGAYGYGGGYGGGYYDYAPGYGGTVGAYPNRAVDSQPSPRGGVESQR